MMTSNLSDHFDMAFQRRTAAELILEAKKWEFEAACWLGLQTNIEQARASVHRAMDAVVDAIDEQVRANKRLTTNR